MDQYQALFRACWPEFRGEDYEGTTIVRMLPGEPGGDIMILHAGIKAEPIGEGNGRMPRDG